MNRKVLIITMICILTVLAGCGKKAEPIDLPSNEAVTSIEVITIDGAKADITEANQIETVMTALSAAEPTRLESVNDQPTNVDAYGTISINTVGESTVVYYYDKDSKHYIEQPYRGIYEMEDYLEETLLQEYDIVMMDKMKQRTSLAGRKPCRAFLMNGGDARCQGNQSVPAPSPAVPT